jgi:hypothetical protein
VIVAAHARPGAGRGEAVRGHHDACRGDHLDPPVADPSAHRDALGVQAGWDAVAVSLVGDQARRRDDPLHHDRRRVRQRRQRKKTLPPRQLADARTAAPAPVADPLTEAIELRLRIADTRGGERPPEPLGDEVVT